MGVLTPAPWNNDTEGGLCERRIAAKGSFTYYVISRGRGGVSKYLRLITGGGGGGGGGLVVDYVIKICICNQNFHFYQFEKKIRLIMNRVA